MVKEVAELMDRISSVLKKMPEEERLEVDEYLKEECGDGVYLALLYLVTCWQQIDAKEERTIFYQ